MNELTYWMKIVLIKQEKFFGPGVVTLLEQVDQTHSLLKASKEMSLAYTKALKMIKTAEQNLGFAFLERTVGGASGGGSVLTPKARKMIRLYHQFEHDVKHAADVSFETLKKNIDTL